MLCFVADSYKTGLTLIADFKDGNCCLCLIPKVKSAMMDPSLSGPSFVSASVQPIEMKALLHVRLCKHIRLCNCGTTSSIFSGDQTMNKRNHHWLFYIHPLTALKM